MKAEHLSPAQILAVSANAPEKLFSGDVTTAKAEYRALSLKYHPDHNKDPEAVRVFRHITDLYKTAVELIENNAWRGRGFLTLLKPGLIDSKQIEYLKIVPFELGDIYIAETEVVFSVRREFADLFENAKRQIYDFHWANDRMRSEVERYLPQNPEYYSTGDNLVMVLPKAPDLILLEDLRVYLGGAIEAKHVAWIQSSLHNLACYFNFTGIVHNDISPHTYFISPVHHYGALFGGWWYARKDGEKINALPNRTMKLAPADVIRRKEADARVDLELIRATGRELLGNPNGAELRNKTDVPAALANWLNGATTGKAVVDYELWKYVLEQSYGARQFVSLNVNASEVYE